MKEWNESESGQVRTACQQRAMPLSAGVMLLARFLTAVMSHICVLLDSAEEDGGLLRFVCLQTNIYSDAMCSTSRGLGVISVTTLRLFT